MPLATNERLPRSPASIFPKVRVRGALGPAVSNHIGSLRLATGIALRPACHPRTNTHKLARPHCLTAQPVMVRGKRCGSWVEGEGGGGESAHLLFFVTPAFLAAASTASAVVNSTALFRAAKRVRSIESHTFLLRGLIGSSARAVSLGVAK